MQASVGNLLFIEVNPLLVTRLTIAESFTGYPIQRQTLHMALFSVVAYVHLHNQKLRHPKKNYLVPTNVPPSQLR